MFVTRTGYRLGVSTDGTSKVKRIMTISLRITIMQRHRLIMLTLKTKSKSKSYLKTVHT
jgi:hypothetical protein